MAPAKYNPEKISISAYAGQGFFGSVLRFTAPIIDWILGISKINTIYRSVWKREISKEEFVTQLLQYMNVSYHIPKGDLNRIPEAGPLIIVANHPFGGLEGIILAKMLSSIRSDVKIMANVGLKVFPELRDFFIFTNPLVTHNPKNIRSIKNCREHLENGGLLLFFPAGKVAHYRKDKKSITDGHWNRIAAHLSTDLNIPVLPMFISGRNSRLFIFLGTIYYRFKLLMLPREFAKRKKETVEIRCGFPISASVLKEKGKSEDITNYLRMFTYLLAPESGKEEIPLAEPMPPLKKRPEKSAMIKEVNNLPAEQHLVDYKQFSVYCGCKKTMANIIEEITVLREKTFRELDEGSGQPCDTDHLDNSYTHIFIWDNDNEEVIGAYRMGQTDEIDERYLSHMFDFSEQFKRETEPALEMGRSFIISKHQKSFYGLFLLWRGIGEFCVRHPRYRKLYGSVSLSNIYSRKSISLIDKILTPETSPASPKIPYNSIIHSEVGDYLNHYRLDFKDLSLLVKSIEPDGKDIPILLKQYWKLGAKFYRTGVDTSFLETPGLLLVVDLPNAPRSSLKMYLDEGMYNYLSFK